MGDVHESAWIPHYLNSETDGSSGPVANRREARQALLDELHQLRQMMRDASGGGGGEGDRGAGRRRGRAPGTAPAPPRGPPDSSGTGEGCAGETGCFSSAAVREPSGAASVASSSGLPASVTARSTSPARLQSTASAASRQSAAVHRESTDQESVTKRVCSESPGALSVTRSRSCRSDGTAADDHDSVGQALPVPVKFSKRGADHPRWDQGSRLGAAAMLRSSEPAEISATLGGSARSIVAASLARDSTASASVRDASSSVENVSMARASRAAIAARMGSLLAGVTLGLGCFGPWAFAAWGPGVALAVAAAAQLLLSSGRAVPFVPVSCLAATLYAGAALLSLEACQILSALVGSGACSADAASPCAAPMMGTNTTAFTANAALLGGQLALCHSWGICGSSGQPLMGTFGLLWYLNVALAALSLFATLLLPIFSWWVMIA